MKLSRIFRPARYQRGNTNITRLQPIDSASWVWHPMYVEELPGLKPRFVHFRNEFTATEEKIVFDISADERFVLMLDGKIVSRGPNRGTITNWQYHTYEAELEPGQHVFDVVCWTIGDAAPLAQLSLKGGFIFKAEGAYDAALTTTHDNANWQVGTVSGTTTMPPTRDSRAWGSGGTFDIVGNDVLHTEPENWTKPVQVREPIGRAYGELNWGLHHNGWMLYPAQLPDQMEKRITPGAFKAVAEGAAAMEYPYYYTEADAKSEFIASCNALLKDGKKLTVPANTSIRALWDLDDYYGVYPEIVTDKGNGATIQLLFHESLHDKENVKHNRDEFIGKTISGYGDTYHTTGAVGHFTPLWWRTGRWAELIITTADEPLEITNLALIESRYPLERESFFESDDSTLDGVQKICRRGMQMCCHEMLFDCPFYEQQQYPGDTRVQLLVLSALSRDDRMIRRAIETYDLAMRDDGTIPFNYPTRGTQEGASYTLCWLLMFSDYVMWHDNADWLKARVPGMRHTLSGLATYEDEDGILRNLPGWNFLDWVLDNSFRGGSWAPGAVEGCKERGSILTLFWVLALQGAARVERVLGDEAMAAYWEAKAARSAESIIRLFWDESRGAIADTDAKSNFSEHALSLSIVADILPADKLERTKKVLLEADDLTRASVYFSYYLFEAYFKIGRGEIFQKRLDLWRDYVKLGLRTPLESPGDMARSDCHAWGSHPIYWLQSGVAGVMPSSPFFKTVRIAPQPGSYKFIKTSVPSPKGMINVDLKFADSTATGSILLPAGLTGTFSFCGQEMNLSEGNNRI